MYSTRARNLGNNQKGFGVVVVVAPLLASLRGTLDSKTLTQSRSDSVSIEHRISERNQVASFDPY